MLLFPLLVFTLICSTVSTSFYDNPEQDPILPRGPEIAAEPRNKWEFEVFIRSNIAFQHRARFMFVSIPNRWLMLSSGLSLAFRISHT